MKNNNKTVRFKSEISANNFAKKVGGTVNDLRSNPVRNSDFKVTFNKSSTKSDRSYDPSDFDDDINMNGMHWHTAEDL